MKLMIIRRIDDFIQKTTTYINDNNEYQVIQNDSKDRCIFCNKSEDETYMISLNGIQYICKNCLIECLETMGSQGISISLNLKKIAPEFSKRMFPEENS